MNHEIFRDFINRHEWTLAKTYAAFCPHEYLVMKKLPGEEWPLFPEIARLIRLRDIGGIIIIDFIDMESPENRLRVSGALEEALRDDFRKTAVHGFTSLGLLEMTRKRN